MSASLSLVLAVMLARAGGCVTYWTNDSSEWNWFPMARITVEDCVERVPSRFELVMLSAQRARDISAGAPLTLERDNDKNPVIALREIADETLDLDHLRYELIHGLRRHSDSEPETSDDLAQELEALIPSRPIMDDDLMPDGIDYGDGDILDED